MQQGSHLGGDYRRLALALLLVAAIGPARALAEPKLVEERASTYNNIFIYKDGADVIMTFGHNRRFYTESIYDSTDELALPVTYTRYMTVGLAYADAADNLLEVGFGGGRTAWYLHKHMPALDITCVELDPAVVDLAQKHFAVRPEDKFKITISDGRNYLVKSPETWNVIMIDAYRGPFVPFHLLTEEFYKIVKSKLKPGGVVVQNVEPTTMMFDSAVATIQKVFANVEVYDAAGNIVTVAYDGPQRPQEQLMARAEVLQKQHKFVYPLAAFLSERRAVKRSPGKVLTDDFAPVESLLAIEKHNRKLDEFSEPLAK
ncbi:MAG: fused MFS/spermidine synthase [Hyphomicrobiaceae bacterium]|nr:fused MFS/spermidine synthase [Hyphomicrobiaceae bacterium]